MATDPNNPNVDIPKVQVYSAEDGSHAPEKPAKARSVPSVFIVVAVIIAVILLLTYLF